VWDLYRHDVVREMYVPGNPGVVPVLETATREEAENVLASLPLVKASLIDFELIELHPFRNLEKMFEYKPKP
jgi:hypothetical protein